MNHFTLSNRVLVWMQELRKIKGDLKVNTVIFKNMSEYFARSDFSVNGASQQFSDNHPDYEDENSTNYGCWNCEGSTDCRFCLDCTRCQGLVARLDETAVNGDKISDNEPEKGAVA